jgi:RNA polymerase-binding transcription factor DksA
VKDTPHVHTTDNADDEDIYTASWKTCKEAQQTIDRYRAALEKIANTDYRGNRSTEQEIAYRALQSRP